MIFYYFNPALWYFGLLLQLYLVFPLLFRLLQRLGVGAFLFIAAVVTFGCRYFLLCVMPVNGDVVQGAFFVPRLWEFAFGMAAGWLYRKLPEHIDGWLFSPAGLAAGAVVYTLGLYCYAPLWRYTFADALTGSGLSICVPSPIPPYSFQPKPHAVPPQASPSEGSRVSSERSETSRRRSSM